MTTSVGEHSQRYRGAVAEKSHTPAGVLIFCLVLLGVAATHETRLQIEAGGDADFIFYIYVLREACTTAVANIPRCRFIRAGENTTSPVEKKRMHREL